MNHMMTITTAKKPTMKKKANLLLGNTDETTMNHIIINTAKKLPTMRQINETTMNHMTIITTAKKLTMKKKSYFNIGKY